MLPTSSWKHAIGHPNQMGMVRTYEIGRSACLPPKSVIAAHGGASETERMSIDDEDLASPSWFKIQSIPGWRQRELTDGAQDVYLNPVG